MKGVGDLKYIISIPFRDAEEQLKDCFLCLLASNLPKSTIIRIFDDKLAKCDTIKNFQGFSHIVSDNFFYPQYLICNFEFLHNPIKLLEGVQ